MKDSKTTIFGSLAAVCTALIPAVPDQFKAYLSIGVLVFGTLFSYFSKDKGTTPTPL